MSGVLRVGSLFTGIGGFDRGVELAGFETAWQVENDRDCVSVLERHWPGVRRLGDIREVTALAGLNDRNSGSLDLSETGLDFGVSVGQPVTVGTQNDTVSEGMAPALTTGNDVVSVTGGLTPATPHTGVTVPAANGVHPGRFVGVDGSLGDDVALALVPGAADAVLAGDAGPVCQPSLSSHTRLMAGDEASGVSIAPPRRAFNPTSTLTENHVHRENDNSFSPRQHDYLGPVDIVVGGFPCQDLSVAGKRAGLGGERSGLFWEFIRIVREMRESTGGLCPRLIVLENVPGLLSSNDGRDFALVLGGLQQLGALDIAWRVLDSQGVGDCALHRVDTGFWAVPQRRRRIFLVADFGAERAVEILALPDGLSRHPQTRVKARQGAPRALEAGAGVDRGAVAAFGGNRTAGPIDVATSLLAHGGPNGHGDFEITHRENRSRVAVETRSGLSEGDSRAGIIAPFDERVITSPGNRSEVVDGATSPALNSAGEVSIVANIAGEGDVSPPLMSGDGPHVRAGHRLEDPLVVEGDDIAFNHQAGHGNDTSFRGKGRQDITRAGDYTGALRAGGQDAVAYSLQLGQTGANGGNLSEGVAATVETSNRQAVGYSLYPESGQGADLRATETDTATTVAATDGERQTDRGVRIVEPHASRHGGWIVRRLMPVECERLQGFPDDWTRYRQDGSEINDGPRYRILGNAVSVTVAYWLACRVRVALGVSS